MKYVVFCMCRTIKMLISNWPRKLKFSQFYRQGRHASCFWLFSPRSRVGHALRPIFMLWLVKIWQEFMREIYAASWNLFTLTAEAGRVFCQPMYKKWNSAAIKSLLLFVASLFIGFLVKKYVACQSWKSDFGWHRFRFSPCLTRKRVEKSETILALLDSFKELHLEW